MNKAELGRLALELRGEVGVDAHAAFDPYRLAEQYGIEVHLLSTLDCVPAAAHFTVTRPAAFSGALVPVGTGAVILENDAHDRRRRRSTAAHEMAHWVREHPFTTPLMASSERGCRIGDREQEAEATELAGQLLVPTDGAVRLAFRDATDEDAAERFDVSIEMARWRMNGSGARKRARRAAAARHH